jgi:hypothetical protein
MATTLSIGVSELCQAIQRNTDSAFGGAWGAGVV